MGAISKTSIVLVAWSFLLICLFETRMKAEVSALQADHHRQVEELTRRHAVDIVTAHVEDMHTTPGSLAAAGNVASSSPATFGASGAMDGVASQAAEVPVETSAVVDLDSGGADTAVGVSLRGKSIDASELGTPIVLEAHPRGSERRLPGFFSIGTVAAGVGCFEFGTDVSPYTTEADMSAQNCRGASNMICSGCFVALEKANNQILEIIKCSTARYKLSGQLTPAGAAKYVMMIEIINADVDHTLTVKGCDDALCGSVRSTYTLQPKDSAVGYCHHLSSNVIYFGTSGIQNAATFDFSGKTITDLGTVTTADINGGSIDGVAIAGGTINVAAGTLTLQPAEISANKITGGLFTSSQTYNFAGSTITDLGTVTTADINAGTIDDVAIGSSNIVVPSGKTLDVSGGTLTLAGGQVAATSVKGGTFATGTAYSFTGSTISDLGTVTTAAINGGTIDTVTIAASDITVGNTKTLDVSAGTLTLNGGQIAAAAIKGGTFATGTAFSFAGSTISSLGTVTSIGAVAGGTLDNVIIGGSTEAAGTFVDLKTTALGVLSLGMKGAVTGDSVTLNKQQGVITSSTSALGVGAVVSITLSNTEVAATSVVMATAGPCTGGSTVVTNVSPTTGSVSIVVKNDGGTVCSSIFKIYFVVFP